MLGHIIYKLSIITHYIIYVISFILRIHGHPKGRHDKGGAFGEQRSFLSSPFDAPVFHPPILDSFFNEKPRLYNHKNVLRRAPFLDRHRRRGNVLSFTIVDDSPCYSLKRRILEAERPLAPVFGLVQFDIRETVVDHILLL